MVGFLCFNFPPYLELLNQILRAFLFKLVYNFTSRYIYYCPLYKLQYKILTRYTTPHKKWSYKGKGGESASSIWILRDTARYDKLWTQKGFCKTQIIFFRREEKRGKVMPFCSIEKRVTVLWDLEEPTLISIEIK